MKSSYSETPKPINPFTEDYSDYSKIGDITIDKIPYNDMVITCQVLKTFSNAADNKHLFLYLFPGQGDNEEWDKKAEIARLMTYIQINVNRHPEMTIVMPHIYYGGSDKIIEAEQITEYLKLADSMNLSAIVEAHDEEEIERALAAGARIIGVNNRNLKDFTVDINNSIRLRKIVPSEKIFVAESGIQNKEDVKKLYQAGINAVLIGETFMRAENKKEVIRQFHSEIK